MIGTEFLYTANIHDWGSTENYSSSDNEIVVKAHFRKYLYEKDNLFLFLGSGMAYRRYSRKDDDVDISKSSLLVNIGLDYFINKRFAIEAVINTSSNFMNPEDVNSGFSFGIKYFHSNNSFKPPQTTETIKRNWTAGLSLEGFNRYSNNNNKISKEKGINYRLKFGRFFGPDNKHLTGFSYSTRAQTNSNGAKGQFSILTPYYEYYHLSQSFTPVLGIYSSFNVSKKQNNGFDVNNEICLGLAYFKGNFLFKANFLKLAGRFNNEKSDNYSLKYSKVYMKILDTTNIELLYRW